MSKRILSMFLVVVMLILAVPVFALPSLADEGEPEEEIGFKASSTLNKTSENWPTLVDKNPDLDNGQFGKWGLIPADDHGLFGDGWNFGGVVNGKFVPFYDFESQYSTLVYADGTAWGLPLITFSGPNWGSNKGNTAGFSYLAPYTGTVDVSVSTYLWSNAANIGFGIMVDNVLVYPTQTEGTTYYYAGADTTLKVNTTLNVKAGQTIAFVYNNPAETGVDAAYASEFNTTVTYTAITEAGDATYSADAALMLEKAHNGNRGKLMAGEYASKTDPAILDAYLGFNRWSFGSIDYDNYNTYVDFTYVGNQYGWLGNENVASALWSGNGGYQLASQSFCATGAKKAVSLRYYAEFDGTVEFAVKLMVPTGDVKAEGQCYYTIIHNGEVVWPVNATAVNDTANAHAVTNASLMGETATAAADMTAALADFTLKVSEGDRIDFVQYRDDGTYQNVTFGPCVTYTAIDYTVPMTFKFVNAEAGTTETVMVAPNEDGTVNFTTPDAGDTLGWFEIDAAGRIISADAYQGAILKEGKTFYAFSTTATLAPGKSWPTVVNGKVLYPSTISFGKYNDQNKFVPYDVFNNDASGGRLSGAPGEWGDTGGLVYLGVNENRMVTALKGAATINWTALVDGKVEVDFLKLSIDRNSDGPRNEGNSKENPSPMHSDTAFVIVHNGVIVWPKAAAGTNFDLAEGIKGAEGTWYYDEIADLAEAVQSWSGNGSYWTKAGTGDLLASLEAYLADPEKDDALPTIEVKAGDNVQIVFAKVGTSHISANAAVNYVEVADDATLWEGIVTSVPMYTSAQGDNKATDNWSTETRDQLAAIYSGNWTVLGYKNNEYGDASKAIVVDTLIHKDFTTVNSNDDTFYSVAGSTLGQYPVLRAHGAAGYWGEAGVGVATPNNMMGGWVYTAEYTGLVDLSFAKLSNAGMGDVKDTALAIFVNGTMVWPTAGGAANKADADVWYADWYQMSGAGDYAAAVNATAGLDNIFVNKGDVIEFMITGNGGVYGNKMNMSPVVTYNTLSTISLAPEMYTTYSGTFSATVGIPYDFFDVVGENLTKITVTVDGETTEITADEEGYWMENGFTVDGIAPKNLVDEFTYEMTATIAGREVVLASGTTSIVDYLYSLLDSEYAEDYKATVVAVLNYAAAAQTYFGYKTDDLANAGLTAEDKTLADNTATSVLEKGTLEGATATITGFTLLLQDKLTIKTFIDAANATGLKLEVLAYEEDFAYNEETGEWDTVGAWNVVAESELTACAGGDGYKAYFAIEGNWDYSTAYQFRVVNADGEVVSATVTYSVESYIARKADSEAAELLKALLAYATNV